MLLLASFPGAEDREERAPGTHCSRMRVSIANGHVVELGACTNMTINGSREKHKLSKNFQLLFSRTL